MYKEFGEKVDLLESLKCLKGEEVLDMPEYAEAGKGGKTRLRVYAVWKSQRAVLESERRLSRKSGRKQEALS